ncbi:class I SAM-dependent methyltransferase [Streptomyces sp. NPDC012623]|uniref:class I SAM-dependent methyltransferase n=1 Tax=unclassified Streptomyces TaxID=2593676 RepID=UPI00367C3F11
MDSGLNHSSGYFEDAAMSLDNAQLSKNAEIVRKCRIQPSNRVLDIGCGWGAAARLAAAEYHGRVTGLTLSTEQHAYAVRTQEGVPEERRVDFRLQSWEDFAEPVDRIICVNAFETFKDKDFFLPHCRRLLPDGGVMVMLTVTADRPIFRVVPKERIVENGVRAGFDVDVSGSLASHYTRTLEHFVANLKRNRTRAVAIAGAAEYEKQVAHYTQCAGFLRRGLNDMYEFTFTAR